MSVKLLALSLGLLHVVSPLPTLLQDLDPAGDTMAVGSYVREVRAAAPQDYHKTYENEGDGEIGYSRKKSGGGKKGYQHFDSYHKKAGDHYEFEKADSFGLEDKDERGAHSHRHEAREPYRKREARHYEGDDSPADVPHYERYEGAPSQKQKKKKTVADAYDTAEVHAEEYKEGAPDGNGGVEANGHDPNDYVLPEKYTYGPDDADFKY